MARLPRHLTREAKRRELEHYASLRAQSHVAQPGEHGHLDPDIIPLCDKLNTLPGVCTLQSCAGHVLDDGYLRSGHLWLWLDKATAERFDQQAWTLVGAPTIERVARLYLESGQEITCMEFAGNEKGLLRVSGEAILAFFDSLSR